MQVNHANWLFDMEEDAPRALEIDPETSSKKTKNLGRLAARERKRAPEARQLHVEQNATGHIGHVLLAAESTPRPAKREKTAAPVSEKRIDTISRAELLSLSETIMIDGTSLRQIYETHLIGERGLRRLVAEHARGGDLNKALCREVTEREIDFERDPVLRDMVPQHQAPGAGGASTAVLSKLLEKVSIDGIEAGEEAAFYKARAYYETQQLQQHRKQHRAVDVAIAITIALLVALVIILYLTRR